VVVDEAPTLLRIKLCIYGAVAGARYPGFEDVVSD
jgi:hypothetical protein